MKSRKKSNKGSRSAVPPKVEAPHEPTSPKTTSADGVITDPNDPNAAGDDKAAPQVRGRGRKRH